MKLLVDAQLPVRLAETLAASGHDVLHTRELVDGNRTTDSEIARVADADDRVVVTKDHDFLDSHLLKRTPRRLLLVSTGNIHNNDLIALIARVETLVVDAFELSDLVELSRDAVIAH